MECLNRSATAPIAVPHAESHPVNRIAGSILLVAALFTGIPVAGIFAQMLDRTALAEDRGLLDEARLPASHDTSVAAAKTPKLPAISELKQERKILMELGDNRLKNRAKFGDRSAQLILAERFATEAESLAFVPVAANSALSDAAYWYSTAAKRGFPGAVSIDRAFPSFPLRAIRSSQARH